MVFALLFQTKEMLLRLWYHESCRIFQDRLVNAEDRDWFAGQLKDKIVGTFQVGDVLHVLTNLFLISFFNIAAEHGRCYPSSTCALC